MPDHDPVLHATTIALSDGRELVFYDEGPTPREVVDPRALTPSRPSSQLRLDPLTDEWVVLAAHRQDRTMSASTPACPLCPSTASNRTEIPAGAYDVVVFENRFPSLGAGSPDATPSLPAVQAPGTGRCEVVCFSDDHDATFASLPTSRVRAVVDVWADRTARLNQLDEVVQVFVFENRGSEIGATMSHPHGQIYAYPFIAPRWRQMLELADHHRRTVGGNLFAEVLADELSDGVRIVASTTRWTAYVPAAARWPVEVHVVPNRQVGDLTELDGAERDEFAALYPDLLARLDGLFSMPLPYVAAWYQAPKHEYREVAYLRLVIFSTRRSPDKLKYLAGSEAAMGVFINDVSPEDLARRLQAGSTR